MSDTTDNSIKNLRAKIKSIRFAMLTTQNDDHGLSSRPMTQQQLDDNGILWFFVSDESQVAQEINRQPKINVTFAEPADSIYVAISGNALSDDQPVFLAALQQAFSSSYSNLLK